MIKELPTRYNGVYNCRGEVTFPQKKEEMICQCCGHDLTYHAHTQWRSFWMCEHSDCECTNFELA